MDRKDNIDTGIMSLFASAIVTGGSQSRLLRLVQGMRFVGKSRKPSVNEMMLERWSTVNFVKAELASNQMDPNQARGQKKS